MLFKQAEPDDPTMLVGVTLPGDETSVREMARAFAEEFASIGFDHERLLAVFCSPRYAGPNHAFLLLGEEEIGNIIAESVACFGAVRYVVCDAPPERRFVIDADTGCITTVEEKD